MPLPAALAARLAKRGIIKEQPASVQPNKTAEEIEEVFAEDYDDPAKPDIPEPQPAVVEEKEGSDNEEFDTEYVHEVINCPNKSNMYHTCVKFCQERWGLKSFESDPDMLRRKERMLRKYPLPDGWKEVADPDTGRYYYWSVQTDQVCWLSPGHPKAVISMPADRLAGTLSTIDDDLDDQDEEMEHVDDEAMDAESDLSDSSSGSDSEEEKHRPRREPDRGRQEGRGKGWREDRDIRRGRSRRDEIDPMDPAAYSDVPRGSWTDGLDTRGSAKTGVDVTASGPLFQQRPYPSPGDILRANQQLKKKV